MISAQVLITRPWLSTTDWLKLKPFRLNAIVLIPKAVNQIPTTGQAAKKKCKERELLKLAYWNISRSKYREQPQCYKSLPLDQICNISRFIFSGFPDQTRGYQGTMHSTE